VVTVDYPNGRVVFDAPVPQTGVVQCEYSYRLFQLYTADAPWWQQLQTDSFRADDPQFLQVGSGAWDVLAQNRVQLPAVVVEAVPRRPRGYEVGGGETVQQDVLFHVLAEDRFHYKWLHDALTPVAEAAPRVRQEPPAHRPTPSRSTPTAPQPPASCTRTWSSPDRRGRVLLGAEFGVSRTVRSCQQPRSAPVHYCTVRATVEVDLPE
jgi:hypothetical protein